MPPTRIQDEDRAAVAEFIQRHWRSTRIMSHGECYYPHKEDALIERRNDTIVGLLTFRFDDDGMELLTLNATVEGHGIGTALMLASIDLARQRSCRRIWLTTTNDNLHAIGFYQRLGFRMTAIHPGAVDEARMLKPEIPKTGERGIPIHDEIVMELGVEPYLDE